MRGHRGLRDERVERVVLVHVSGVRAGRREVYSIARLSSLYFGRGPECDVRFDADLELMVSRSHAVLEWSRDDPRRFSLTDLLSSNGTFINGHQLSGVRELRTGDEVQLGVSGPVLRFEVELEEPDNSPSITRPMAKVELPPVTTVQPTTQRQQVDASKLSETEQDQKD